MITKNLREINLPKIKKENIILLLISFLIFIIAFPSYESFVSQWSYQGYTFQPSILKIFITITITSFFTLFFPLKESFINYVSIYIFFILGIPSLFIFFSNDASFEYIFLSMAPNIFLYVLSKIKFPSFNINYPIKQIKNIKILNYILIILITGLIVFLFLRSYSQGLVLLREQETYLLRDALSATGLQSGIIAYPILMLPGVLIPLIITLTLKGNFHKITRFFILVILILLGLLLYSSTSGRSVLLIVPYSVYYLFATKNIKNFILLTGCLSLIFCLMGYLSYIFGDSKPFTFFGFISGATFRRQFLIPPFANLQWMQHFNHPSTWFYFTSFPLVREIFDIKNQFTPAQLLAFANGYTTGSMSTGIVGSGYAELGFLGSLLFTGFASLIIKVWNDLLNRNQFPIFVAFLISWKPLMALYTQSTLFSSLLSHGVLLSIFLTLIIPPKIFKFSRKNRK